MSLTPHAKQWRMCDDHIPLLETERTKRADKSFKPKKWVVTTFNLAIPSPTLSAVNLMGGPIKSVFAEKLAFYLLVDKRSGEFAANVETSKVEKR
jgi:hypothetical protein